MTETSAPTTTANRNGFGDFLFRWRGWGVIALGAVLLAAWCLLHWPPRLQLRWALAAGPIVLIGVAFRVWARCYFTRGSDTRRIQAHRLIVFGPYRRVRNPLYVGNIAIAIGLAFAFTDPWGALVLLAALLLLYTGVIRSEEAILRATYGESYVDFCRRVPRWIPRLFALPADADAPVAQVGHALKKERQRIAGALGAWLLAIALALWSTTTP